MTAKTRVRKTVVTLTPLPIRSDTRTLKQATSVARLGYRSIVLEGLSSALDPNSLPFELIASSEPAAPPPESKTPEPPASAPVTSEHAAPLEPNLQAGGLQPERPPPAPGNWGAFRRAIGEYIETLPGGKKLASKFSRFLFLLRVDRVAALKMLLFWPYYFLVVRPKWLIVSTYNKIRYSKFTAYMVYVIRYLDLYIVNTVKKIPNGNLYYVHSFYQFPALFIKCKLNNAIYIYDAHDFYSEMDAEARISNYWRDWIVPFHLRIERACIRRAAAVVTVNEGIAALMKEKFGRDVLVLRNSHDPRLETPVEKTIRDVLSLPTAARLIVCVGQWKPDTAISQAIEAFAALSGCFHLAFLGAGFPSYSDEVAARGLTGRVHFLPAVKSTEVVPFIRSADIGLLLYHPVSPSIRNCLPNGFFQPTAAGLPILYPRLPEIMRLAEVHDLGLAIDPLDPASIRAGVEALGGDDELYRSKKANVLAARDFMSWERDEEQLKSLIEGLIGPPCAG